MPYCSPTDPISEAFATLERARAKAQKDATKAQIALLIPDIFPLNILESALLNIYEQAYIASLPTITSQACSRGRQVYSHIAGAVDAVLGDAKAAVNAAKAELENMISQLKTQLGAFQTDLSKALADAEAALGEINALKTQANDALYSAKLAASEAGEALAKVRENCKWLEDLEHRVQSLESKGDSIQSLIRGLIPQ